MAIRLEIYATDPEVISLVQRYWALNEECKPVENVSAMLPFREVLKPHALAAYIRTHCTVYDENQNCSVCGCALVITSRSEVKRFKQHPLWPCAACKAELEEARRIVEAQAEADLQESVAQHAERVIAKKTDYSTIPNNLAFVLVALERAIAPRLFGGRFTFNDCQALAPMHSEMFINRLWKAGVLSDDPRAAGTSAYFVNANGLNYYPNKIRFMLVPDERLGGGKEAFNELVVRPFTNEGMLALWYEYAVADCMAYLNNQLQEFRQVFPVHKTEEIKSAIYTALKYYSTRDVWSLLWRVVQTVSSNSNHKYSNKERSAGTIASKLRLQFKKARKEKTDLGEWNRLKSIPAGTLGQIFYELYDIDETTDASVIIKTLSDEEPLDREEIEASIGAHVKELMASALANRSGAAAIYDFAELIRNGAGISEAVEQIAEIYAVNRADEPSTC
jgi:hypothetical protein